MDIKSNDEIRDIIAKDLSNIRNRKMELLMHLDENFEDSLTFIRALVFKLSQPSSGPVVAKTPKIVRKRAVQRVETIPEDESVNELKQETIEEIVGGRVKRSASKRAADNIKKQYSITVSKKLRPSYEDENPSVKKTKGTNQIKRKKSVTSSSDEEEYTSKSTSKYSRLDQNLTQTKRSTRKIKEKKFVQVDQQQPIVALKRIKHIEKSEGKDSSESPISICSSRSRFKKSLQEGVNKNDDVTSNTDDCEEPSMYEDVIQKSIPIMHSTIKSDSLLPEKTLNATVVLGRLSQQRKLNETVIIQKKISREKNEQLKERTSIKNNSQTNKQTTQYINSNELITDDESSPERKNIKKVKRRAIVSSSEDEIPITPTNACFKDTIVPTVRHETKTTYKSNALFSPYAKESVKKRVEAFEQAVMYSPKSIDVDVSTKLTKPKTRAIIAAENEAEVKNAEKNVVQILARKSLAKAKKISLAKQIKDNEDFKEYPKRLTASHTNIVSNIESFITSPKSISKVNSVEKLEDKRLHEEDARKKREEALRLQTEEKKRKRQERELKNKLAREAKEKQDLQKRQKAEREKEEKARLALLMQEKQREELEKKRLAQLQRAQEKEERRKLEEQQRLQKLQEQEETERLFAEQKRRELEVEKRKEAEARAQAAEALKQKQMLAAKAKYKQTNNNKNQAPINYVLNSDPDDDESDDESRPKHEIPHWAHPHVRKAQLAMQQHIKPEIVHKFFDTRKCTPNLAELFIGIDKRRLVRTSSAIWKIPPRFSMMEAD